MEKLHARLTDLKQHYPPKSPMGVAISYALKNWTELTVFLDHAKVPPDNNRSEFALRIVAVGRQNFLLVGDEDNGQNLAGLYSLVPTWALNAIDPLAYLTDVLGRVATHPATQLDDLLPQKWYGPTGRTARPSDRPQFQVK